MSKFCQNCGNMLDDSAAFCDKCGKAFEAPAAPAAPQAPAAPEYQAPAAPEYQAPAAPEYQAPAAPEYQAPAAPQQYQAPAAPQYGAPQQYQAPQYGAPQYGTAVAEKKSPLQNVLQFVKDKKIFFIGGAVVLVLIIVLCIIIGSCASNSPKGALEKAFNGAKNLNVKQVAQLNYEMQFDKDATSDSINKQIQEAEKQINDNKEMVNMMKSMIGSAKLNVTKDEKLDQAKVDELKEDWSYSYKDTDKISEIHELTYSVSGVMGMSGSEETCYAVKVGGKWYIKGMGSIGSLGL